MVFLLFAHEKKFKGWVNANSLEEVQPSPPLFHTYEELPFIYSGSWGKNLAGSCSGFSYLQSYFFLTEGVLKNIGLLLMYFFLFIFIFYGFLDKPFFSFWFVEAMDPNPKEIKEVFSTLESSGVLEHEEEIDSSSEISEGEAASLSETLTESDDKEEEKTASTSLADSNDKEKEKTASSSLADSNAKGKEKTASSSSTSDNGPNNFNEGFQIPIGQAPREP